MSVSSGELNQLMLRPSGLSLFHQTLGAATVPGTSVSSTRARSRTPPRWFSTHTQSPASMPRSRASLGCKSKLGSRSRRANFSMFTKLELRKEWAGGVMQWSSPGARVSAEASGGR